MDQGTVGSIPTELPYACNHCVANYRCFASNIRNFFPSTSDQPLPATKLSIESKQKELSVWTCMVDACMVNHVMEVRDFNFSAAAKSHKLWEQVPAQESNTS